MPGDRITALEALLQDEPDDELTHFLLGREYITASRWDDAARVLARCVAIKPDYTAAWKQLGDSLRQAGRTDEALDAYRSGAACAEKTGDLQVRKECQVFIRRLAGST